MSTFQKYPGNPVFGNETIGTVFDTLVWRDEGRYRMDVSLRKLKACGVAFSDDGIHWSDPVVTLQNDLESGWEDNINRNCVYRFVFPFRHSGILPFSLFRNESSPEKAIQIIKSPCKLLDNRML